MDTDALLLARIQFGFTISCHIVFPGLTIGLASYLAVLEGLWLRTQRPVYMDLYHFWSKVFAVAFGMGVVSGVVMAYQFGTNWSEFSRFAGGITGPLLAYEVLTAFFLEAGFLGVMMFGMECVGPALHFIATCAVAIGTLISSTWIRASNSWMHTPQGHAIIDGRVVPVDWLAVIFNPSFPYRLTHMVLAAFIATALVVGGTAARHLLRRRTHERVRVMPSMALCMLQLSRSLRSANEASPFVYTLCLIFLGYSGLGISLWPQILPPGVTIHDAAGPPQSLGFALVGALLIVPMILMYTAWG